MVFPIKIPAIKIEQPMGTFFAVSLSAEVLLQVCFSDLMKAEKDLAGTYFLTGTQRLKRDTRLQQIAQYIERTDSAFPNSIILAANYTESGYILDSSEDNNEILDRWSISHIRDNAYELTIPTNKKLAAIIDGQHRLFAFADHLKNKDRLEMQLLCSIYLDLPKAYQAQLFATINSTQKPVDKSLTYELYGYNITEQTPEYWSPDKLSVFLTRKLSTEMDSPLYGKIKIAPKVDETLAEISKDSNWRVSTAVVVEGIMKLITSNPTKDSNELLKHKSSKREVLRSYRVDKSVLREIYLTENDNLLYKLVSNYLKACNDIFWKNHHEGSFIVKTVGVQALFDILKLMAQEALENKDISIEYFKTKLDPAKNIDFSTDQFKNASGSGRSSIRRAIQKITGLGQDD